MNVNFHNVIFLQNNCFPDLIQMHEFDSSSSPKYLLFWTLVLTSFLTPYKTEQFFNASEETLRYRTVRFVRQGACVRIVMEKVDTEKVAEHVVKCVLHARSAKASANVRNAMANEIIAAVNFVAGGHRAGAATHLFCSPMETPKRFGSVVWETR